MNLLQTCGGGKCSFIIEWHLCIDCKWVKFASGAFGDWDCGAWWNTEWFQFQLPQQAKEHHITFLELACAALGPQWQGQLIYVWCDNQAAEHAITACSYPGLMHLLQCLFFNFNCQPVIFQELITLQQISCPANNYLSSSHTGPFPPGLNCSVLSF